MTKKNAAVEGTAARTNLKNKRPTHNITNNLQIPIRYKCNPYDIPQSLQQIDSWVLWSFDENDKKSLGAKIPLTLHVVCPLIRLFPLC